MRILDRNNADPPTFEVTFRRLASSDSELEARFGAMMLDLLDHLRDKREAFTVWGHEIASGQLGLIFEARGGWCDPIKIAIDFMDRAPIVQGHPKFHYRLSYAPPPRHSSSHQPTMELRTHDVHEAVGFIVHVIKEYAE